MKDINFDDLFQKIEKNNSVKENLMIVSHKLLLGMNIYYSDNMEIRLGDDYSNVPQNDLHQCNNYEYNVLRENYEFLYKIFEILGFRLERNIHHLSQLESNREYFYLKDLRSIPKKRRLIISRKQILILSIIILETKFGSKYISENDLINTFLKNPNKLLKLKVDESALFKILGRQSIPTIISEKEHFISEEIIKINQTLNDYQYIHRIHTINGNFLISIGAGSFKLTSLFNQLEELEKNA